MSRILAICNFYPPHQLGGYELSCRDVLRRFADREHDVAALTSDYRLPGATDGDQGHPVHRDLRLYWRDHELLSPAPWRRALIERHNQRALRRVLRSFRPDVVSVWNMGTLSLGLLTTVAETRIPMVLVVCDDWLVYGPRLDAWTRVLRDRPRLAGGVRRLTGLPTGPPDLGRYPALFVSEFVRDRAEAESAWSFARSLVTGSGIETSSFPRPVGASTDRAWRGHLLYVGRLDPRKGIETLLRAMAELPDATLEVIGPGPAPYRARLDRLAADLGIEGRVQYDSIEREALATRYREADAVVFPSEWDEPFGLVPVEAMACGTPVVATGTGGSSEVLTDGDNCLLFPKGDAAALAASLRRVAADQALRRRIVAGGLRTAASLDVDRLADVMEPWHAEAAGVMTP